jgi:hypothetical protein
MALSRTLRVLALVAVPVAGSALFVRPASACGGLYTEEPTFVPPKPQNVPSVKEVPQEPNGDPSLVVFDESRGVEHLVREIRFDRARRNFAFLVPVPSKPKVGAIEHSPFAALSGYLPFDPKSPRAALNTDNAGTKGALAVDASDVTVEKVGSFTVTMLAASDTNKVDAWIKENQANDSSGLREWMAHYSSLGFHYAAFHYQSPGDEWSTGVTTETVRLTFETKVPFLPYREVRDDVALGGDERRSDLWVIAKRAHRPIGSRSSWSGEVSLADPFLAGGTRRVNGAELASVLGDVAPLLPSEELVVQSFRDRKSDRRGFGDVLLAPRDKGEHVVLGSPRFVGDPFPPAAREIDDGWARERARYLAVLDSRLESAPKKVEPASPSIAANAEENQAPGGPPWRIVGASAGAVLALILSAAVRRRRVRIGALGCASLFVVGCAASLGDHGAASKVGATPAIARYDDREQGLLAVLDGHHDWVDVDAVEPFARETYRAAIRANFLRLRQCYEPVFRRDSGTVEVRIRINADGSVAAANLAGGTLSTAAVATCVATQIAQVSFPQSAEPVTMRYAVDLGVETIYTPGYMHYRRMPLGFQAY